LKRTIGTLALIGAIALLAGGCGGKKQASTGTRTTTTSATAATTSAAGSTQAASSTGGVLSHNAYDSQMATLGKVLGTSLGTLPAAANAKQAAIAAVKVQQEIRALAKRLQAINPPPKVKAAHAELTKAVNELADQLTPIIAKLQKGNFKALGGVTTLSSFDDIQTAVTKIETAGYTIASS
jgi:hypothetical protein